MMRKTIKVDDILKMINGQLAAEGSTPDGREAICGLLESILFQTGNYQGYRYLDTSEIEGNGTRRYYF